MKAIATSNSSLFFNATTSAGSLTGAWSEPFSTPFCGSDAATVRAARRQLRRHEAESSDWPEMAARAVLAVTMLAAYATAIWQIAGF